MNIQQLRYAVATSEHGTMTAAAAALHVAQPALSRAVRSLECELRVTIFERDGRGVRLTDEGREVIAIASTILADVGRLTSLGDAAGLRVCATKGQARELGVPAVSAEAEDGNRVSLTVVDSREEVFDAVRADHAALGLTDLPGPSDLTAILLGWQEFVLAHPPGWDLPDPMAIKDLAEVPLLAAPAGDWRRDVLVAGLRGSGVEPTIAAETSDRDLLSHLVAEGAGAAFLYGRQAAAAAGTGARVIHLTPPPVRQVGVVFRGRLTGQRARFVEVLQARAPEVLIPPDDAQLARAGRITGPLVLRRPEAAGPHAGLR